MSKTARTIYGLSLNEVEQIGDAFWRRVPGGWVVTETYFEERAEVQHRLHPVFVPFSLPDRDGQMTKQALTQIGKVFSPSPTPPAEQRETLAETVNTEPMPITRPSKMNDDHGPDDDESPGF